MWVVNSLSATVCGVCFEDRLKMMYLLVSVNEGNCSPSKSWSVSCQMPAVFMLHTTNIDENVHNSNENPFKFSEEKSPKLVK